MELLSNPPSILDAVGSADDQRVSRDAVARSHLLAPLEGSVHGPGPPDRNVVGGFSAAEFVDMFRQERGIFGDPLKRRQFVETSIESSFHRRTIVADFPKDERVVQLADLFERIQ